MVVMVVAAVSPSPNLFFHFLFTIYLSSHSLLQTNRYSLSHAFNLFGSSVSLSFAFASKMFLMVFQAAPHSSSVFVKLSIIFLSMNFLPTVLMNLMRDLTILHI